MKGILLAGGTGTSLYPLTKTTSKHLLTVHDRPMVWYPFATLKEAGVCDILLVTTPQYRKEFEALFGDGSSYGVSVTYVEQQKPEGVAQAVLLAEEFLQGEPCVLILGDNLFYGEEVRPAMKRAIEYAREGVATVFACPVQEPERFGVIELAEDGRVLSLEEKPEQPKSHLGVTGLYFYDKCVTGYAKKLVPSSRGELEITDLNKLYLAQGKLRAERLSEAAVWMDMGTPESYAQAAKFVAQMQKQGAYLGEPGRNS